MPRSKTEYVESLKAAAAATGIAIPFLQAARASGCPAFKGSRVRLDILRNWLDDNPEILTDEQAEGSESLLALKQGLLRAQIKRSQEQARAAKLANDRNAGLMIDVDQARETMVLLVSELNGHIRVIEDSLPQSLQGLSLPDQRLAIRKLFDKMREEINKHRVVTPEGQTK